MTPQRTPIGSQRARFVAILVGVIVGYIVGRMFEDRMAWHNARLLTMPVGGIIAGVIARFTFFRDPPDAHHIRRLR